MALMITRGKQFPAVRAVLYAIAGFGKTTLAGSIPNSVFIDVEGSSERYNVARIDAKKLVEILAALKELSANPQGFTTIIIDTADWVQASIEDAMCRAQNKPSIAECGGGFGKGYIEAGRKFSEILELCDSLIFKGVNVLFLAHSMVKKVSPPGEMQAYDRYVLALDEKNFAMPLFEWAEMVLFGKFEADVVETKDKRSKATTDAQRRVLYTSDAAAWFAKNRFSLPREIEVPAFTPNASGDIPAAILPPEIAAIFAGKKKAAPAPAPAPAAPVSEPAIQPPAMATAEQIQKLTDYAKNSVGLKGLEWALQQAKALDASELTESQAAGAIIAIQEAMNAPQKPAETPAKFPWPASFVAWLSANEAAVNTFLVTKQWIQAGQTWRDLPGDRAEQIVERCEAFAKAAKIPAKEEGGK